MHFEFLHAHGVRHLQPCAHDVGADEGALRRWTVLAATEASGVLLRCLALARLGRRRMEALAPQVVADLAERRDRPVELEAVLIRHAPQERPPRGRCGGTLAGGCIPMGRPKPCPSRD